MESICCEKRKVLLHIPAICAVYFLMHAFGETALQLPFSLYRAGIPGLMLYLCLELMNVWAAVFFYSRYILKKSVSQIGLGKPFIDLRWTLGAVIFICLENGFYLIFTKGELQIWNLGVREQLHLLFSNIFIQGLRTAVMDGMLFRALTPSVFLKSFGRKGTAVISSLLYAAVTLAAEAGSFWNAGRFFLQLCALFLKGMALLLVTFATGSVWPSVMLDTVYLAFGGDAHILHIDTEQTFPSVFAYTLENDSWILAGLPETFSLNTALPAVAGFGVIILAAFRHIKTQEKEKREQNKHAYWETCFRQPEHLPGYRIAARIRQKLLPDDLTGNVLEHLLSGIAAGLYLMALLNFGGRNLLQQYFFTYGTKEAEIINELKTYARVNHITADHADALLSWKEQKGIRELLIARDGFLIFNAAYPGKMLPGRSKMPASIWRPWYYVVFSDGGADVYISTGFDEKYYRMLSAFSALAGFAACLGVVTSGMHRQLLEKDQMEKELRMAQEKLVLGMSHDLRTPMTGLLTYMEVIKKQEPQGSSVREYVDKAYDKIVQMKDLSDQMFEYFLIDSQKGVSLEQPEEISSVLGDYLSELCALLDCEGFCVSMQMPEWKPVLIQVNTDYLGRIFNNIFSNLEKYADREQEVVIWIVYERDRAGIVIQNGMAQSGPFAEGTGIGVKNICLMMEQMGGAAQAGMRKKEYRITLYFPIYEAVLYRRNGKDGNPQRD